MLELVAIKADGDSRPVFGKECIASARHAFLQDLAEIHNVPPLNLRILHVTLETSVLHCQLQWAFLRVRSIAVDDKSDGLSPLGHLALNVTFHLPLPRHCNEGKQEGDDGLLVHILF